MFWRWTIFFLWCVGRCAGQGPIEQLRDGYAGSDSCVECHKHEHRTWHASYHRTMTAWPTPENIKGAFDGSKIRLPGVTVQPGTDGEKFWFNFELNGQTIQKPVQQLTGSHHQQVYWYYAGQMRALGLVPLTYLIEDQRWIPRESAFLQPPVTHTDFNIAQWNRNCLRCHTTASHPGMVFGEEGNTGRPLEMQTHASAFGISCEACHGPSKAHVEMRLALKGKTWPKDKQDPVVLPTDLLPEQSNQVCGQCHGITVFKDRTFENDYYTAGETFKPGGDLLDVDRVVWNEQADPHHPVVMAEKAESGSPDRFFWSDGMVRVSGREYNALINSPCYTHDNPEQQMTCFSCHVLHQPKNDARPIKTWANDQLHVDRQDNQACLQCHDTYSETEALVAHTHHAADSPGSQCYNCHMPYTTYGLLKGIRSHTVSSPSVAETLNTGRPNACNHCHLDRGLGWVGDHLRKQYGQKIPRMTREQFAVPASLVALYEGDAGQRALAAWAMGWPDARNTSGADWIPRALVDLLNDPYDAVRYIAQKSLRKDPRFADWDYDFTAEPALREQHQVAALKRVEHISLHEMVGLGLSTNVFNELRARRNDRAVHLLE